MNCVICQRKLGAPREDYFHRGSCGHHQCMMCAIPIIRAGKGLCPRCPAPARADAHNLGNIVLGNDVEQTKRVAAALRAESKVRPLSDDATHSGACACAYVYACAYACARTQ